MAKKFSPSQPSGAHLLGLRPLLLGGIYGLRHGASRTQHPSELFGEDWAGEWEVEGTEDAKEQEAPARQA